MTCLAAFFRARSQPANAMLMIEMQSLVDRTEGLEHQIEALEHQVGILYGSDEENIRLQLAVDKNMKYIRTRPRPKIKYQHMLLDCLLNGADPSRLKDEEDFIETFVRLRASTVGSLQDKYHKVVKLSASDHLITLRMKSALAEVRAVENAAHMTRGHKRFMVGLSMFDTCSDLFMVRVYYENAYYFFVGMSAFGLIGNVFFSSLTLEEWNNREFSKRREPEVTPLDHAVNVLSGGVWSNYKVAKKLSERPRPFTWKLMRSLMRGNAFEAGWAILPNIYLILTSGVVGDSHVTTISMVGQLLSTISSLVMLAHCAHITDIVTALVLCETDRGCWRWFTGAAGRWLMYMYRLCEMCAIVLGLVFSVAARPFGPFYWLAIRGSTTGLVWCVHRYPRERRMYPGATGATLYNPFAFHGATHIGFGTRLRVVRQIEVILVLFAVWLVYHGVCWATPRDGNKWAQEFGLMPFDKKLACTHETRPDIHIGDWRVRVNATNFCNSQSYERLAKLCVVSFGTLGCVLFMLLHLVLRISGVFPGRAAQHVGDSESDSSDEETQERVHDDTRAYSNNTKYAMLNMETM